MEKTKKGMTLLEVLIAAGIFLLLITSVAYVFVATSKHLQKLETESPSQKHARQSAYALSVYLRQVCQIWEVKSDSQGNKSLMDFYGIKELLPGSGGLVVYKNGLPVMEAPKIMLYINKDRDFIARTYKKTYPVQEEMESESLIQKDIKKVVITRENDSIKNPNGKLVDIEIWSFGEKGQEPIRGIETTVSLY